MNERLLSCHSEVRHLGIFFNNRLLNSTDSNHKASHFIGSSIIFTVILAIYKLFKKMETLQIILQFICMALFYGCIIPMGFKMLYAME